MAVAVALATILRLSVSCEYPNSETVMAEPCFSKKDSNPPICGIHNVPLVSKQLPAEMTGGGYKRFAYLVCPVSGSVLNDPTKKP